MIMRVSNGISSRYLQVLTMTVYGRYKGMTTIKIVTTMVAVLSRKSNSAPRLFLMARFLSSPFCIMRILSPHLAASAQYAPAMTVYARKVMLPTVVITVTASIASSLMPHTVETCYLTMHLSLMYVSRS